MDTEITNPHMEKARTESVKRLLTCFTNERLMASYFIPTSCWPCQPNFTSVGCMVAVQNSIEQCFLPGSFWVPLDHKPFVSCLSNEESTYAKNNNLQANDEISTIQRITLLDPEDIRLPLYEMQDTNNNTHWIVRDSVQLIKRVQKWGNLDQEGINLIIKEVENSIMHQAAAYKNRLPIPKVGDANIFWEQSIVEGHAIHPMNKSRSTLDSTGETPTAENLLHPKIHFFAIAKERVNIRGTFEELLRPLFDNSIYNPSIEVVVPVHELQVPIILGQFPFARKLDLVLPMKAQSSLRTLQTPLLPNINVKIPIPITITSVVRTLKPESTHAQHSFNAVLDRIAEDPEMELLIVSKSLGTLAYRHDNFDIVQHLGCIIRQDPESLIQEKNESIIVCAALTERDDDGQFVVNKAFQLDSQSKRQEFLSRYIRLFLRTFLPPVIKFGVSFEPHAQNVLARFSKNAGTDDWELAGFIARDFGGVAVHQQTLNEATGLWFDALTGDDECVVQNISDVYQKAFHTMIQYHLHRVIRALGCHYNGEGWTMVRHELRQILRPGSDLYTLWLETETVNWTCFMKMKLNYGRNECCSIIPNIILFKGTKEVR